MRLLFITMEHVKSRLMFEKLVKKYTVCINERVRNDEFDFEGSGLLHLLRIRHDMFINALTGRRRSVHMFELKPSMDGERLPEFCMNFNHPILGIITATFYKKVKWKWRRIKWGKRKAKIR